MAMPSRPDALVVLGPDECQDELVQRLLDDYDELAAPAGEAAALSDDELTASVESGDAFVLTEAEGGARSYVTRAAMEAVAATGRVCVIAAGAAAAAQIKASRIDARIIFAGPPSLEAYERYLREACTETEASLYVKLNAARPAYRLLGDADALAPFETLEPLEENGFVALTAAAAQFVPLALSQQIVRRGLSQLGVTADGSRMAFLRLDAPECNVSDVQLLQTLPQLQALNLSRNLLVSGASCSQLPFLLHLSLRRNRLSGAALQGLPQSLLTLDVSENRLSSLEGLGALQRLQTLCISSNEITCVSETQRLPALTELDLSSNGLAGAAELPLPPSLRFLRLGSNTLTSLANLPSQMPCLNELQVPDNQLSAVDGVERCPALTVAAFGGNRIAQLEALANLRALPNLKSLELCNNPISELSNFRLRVILPLLRAEVLLQVLDEIEVTAEEKVAALNLDGEADASLAEIRRRHFPPAEAKEGAPEEQAALDAGAAQIQARYRGEKERQRLRDEAYMQSASAIAVQSCYRGRAARDQMQAFHNTLAVPLTPSKQRADPARLSWHMGSLRSE